MLGKKIRVLFLAAERHHQGFRLLLLAAPGAGFSDIGPALNRRVSQHLADYALQIRGFRDPEQHGMIFGLAPFLQNTDLAMSIAGRLQQHFEEFSFRNVERAGTSYEDAAALEHLHRPQIELFVATQCRLKRAPAFSESGWIEHDGFILPAGVGIVA